MTGRWPSVIATNPADPEAPARATLWALSARLPPHGIRVVAAGVRGVSTPRSRRPHHPVYRDGSADLRAVGLALGRLRGRYGDADCHRKGHQSGGPGADADRRYEDGRRPKDSSVARFRRHCADCSSWRAVFLLADDDLLVDRRDMARPGQLPCPLA